MAGGLTISTLNDSSGALATQNGMTGICKAWVNFNGITTATIRGSFNVSSVTRVSAGAYTISFTTALANANYSCIGSVSPQYGVVDAIINVFDNQSGEVAPTVNAVSVTTRTNSVTGLVDIKYICVAIFSN